MIKNFFQFKRLLDYIPLIGIVIFIGLYFLAAFLYPGGTRFDHNSEGYSHFQNFWCDLLDEYSYNKIYNKGRVPALLATVILPISQIPLCIDITDIFNLNYKKCLLIRFNLLVGCISGSFIIIFHDFAIYVFVLFSVIGLCLILYEFFRCKMWKVLTSIFLPFILCSYNFYLWQFDKHNLILAMVQKFAILSSLIWLLFFHKYFLSLKKIIT